jgi:hypothetical protein
MGGDVVLAARAPEVESATDLVTVMSEIMPVRMPHQPDLADGLHAVGANKADLIRVILLASAIQGPLHLGTPQILFLRQIV